MRNSMIVEHGFSSFDHIICICIDCEAKNPNKSIPTFYSFKYAIDSGWVHTKEIKYCDPDNWGGVWVCPSCYNTSKDDNNNKKER